MKTIRSIINQNKKVYVKLSDDETCKRFYVQAEKEGFLFGDSAKPTEKQCSDLIAVLPDKTLCYVNTYGRIASQSGKNDVLIYDSDDIFS